METRRNIRLKGYDYSQAGVYFVTVCTKDRRPIFWEESVPVGATCGRLPLSETGKTVDEEIVHLSAVYPNVWAEKYVVMPNHIHLLICIDGSEDGRPQVAPTISMVVQQFKGSITKQAGRPIWQKSFYDHGIRNQQDYDEIWQYIENNPLKYALKKTP